jgi:formate dehydrogenase subunit gamma
MASLVVRAMVALLASCWLAGACAQSPAVNPAEADLAKQQAARQVEQPGNNAPVWKEIRAGLPQVTTVRGRETDVLIQPQGQTWRAVRVPVATAGGFLFVFALLLLGTFYLWRGPIRLHGAPSGRVIERFTAVERVAHWTVAIAFTTLGVTGLVHTFGKWVLLPLVGYTLFSLLAQAAKTVHDFVGPVLVVALPVMIVLFVRTHFFTGRDIEWLKKGGGMLSGEHVPAEKSNGGQKALFWAMAVGLGTTLCVTGLVLDFPNFGQTRQTMQIANIVHMMAGLLAVCLLAGHIYLGTIGMKGAYEAMRYGYVDETWAREHHQYWYDDVMSGKVPRGAEPPPAEVAHAVQAAKAAGSH